MAAQCIASKFKISSHNVFANQLAIQINEAIDLVQFMTFNHDLHFSVYIFKSCVHFLEYDLIIFFKCLDSLKVLFTAINQRRILI